MKIQLGKSFSFLISLTKSYCFPYNLHQQHTDLKDLIKANLMPKYIYAREIMWNTIKDPSTFVKFCFAVAYAFMERTLFPGVSRIFGKEFCTALLEKKSRLYQCIQQAKDVKYIKTSYKESIERISEDPPLKNFIEGVCDTIKFSTAIKKAAANGFLFGLSNLELLPKDAAEVAKTLKVEEKPVFEMQYFTVMAGVFHCRITVWKVGLDGSVEKKCYGQGAAFLSPLTFLIIEDKKDDSRIILLYGKKVADRKYKEEGLEISAEELKAGKDYLEAEKEVYNVEQKYKTQVLCLLDTCSGKCLQTLGKVARGEADANLKAVLDYIEAESKELEQELHSTNLSSLAKFLPLSEPAKMPGVVNEEANESVSKCLSCGTTSDLIKISCGKCYFCRKCVQEYYLLLNTQNSIMENIIKENDGSTIACACILPDSDKGREFTPEDMKMASPELYEKMLAARRCTAEDCTENGFMIRDGKWLCETHSKCCIVACNQRGTVFLEHANLWICENCFQNRPTCCLPELDTGEGYCTMTGDFLHKSCMNWVCKEHMLRYYLWIILQLIGS
eukprot:TRINITY_DN1357_c0_g1_i1.p1 TRINITY_DN1357_c0_g1~~TRINITY_DN1357_c0_g1_i1.p1  ORF type:complete len:559 (+),score=55.18 TRINITY_DN1357_c0_g1_i1:1019-2695(+)